MDWCQITRSKLANLLHMNINKLDKCINSGNIPEKILVKMEKISVDKKDIATVIGKGGATIQANIQKALDGLNAQQKAELVKLL